MPLLPLADHSNALQHTNDEAQLWRDLVRKASHNFDAAALALMASPQDEEALVAFRACADRLMRALGGRYQSEVDFNAMEQRPKLQS